MTKVHILHENADWLAPFRAAFDAAGLDHDDWHLNGRAVDLAAPPPDGVYFSRMSASALSRGHRNAPETAAVLFDWLALHGRTVVNGAPALRLELSKAAQHAALAAAGVATPRTVVAAGRSQVPAAAEALGRTPFILKPNRGGKGLGVRRVEDMAALAALLPDLQAEPSADDVWLAQEYCPSPDGAITRLEFIGARLHYAVRVRTGGSFELCPAEACAVAGAPPMFEIVEDYDRDLAARLEALLRARQVDIAGVEYLETADGRTLVYDINTNTNYNPEAEARAGVEPGPQALARRLNSLLREARAAA